MLKPNNETSIKIKRGLLGVMIRPELVMKLIADELRIPRGSGFTVAELKVAAMEFQRVDELGNQGLFHRLENP